jgi:hypothetical protein
MNAADDVLILIDGFIGNFIFELWMECCHSVTIFE